MLEWTRFIAQAPDTPFPESKVQGTSTNKEMKLSADEIMTTRMQLESFVASSFDAPPQRLIEARRIPETQHSGAKTIYLGDRPL
jgi:hypothetical protein